MERDRLRRLARARAVERLIDRHRNDFEDLLDGELDVVGLPRVEKVDRALAEEEAERLIRTYGTVAGAGRVIEDRYGLRPGSGARLLRRVRNGSREVTLNTYDRLAQLW